jgi:hypothetical protein
MEVTAMIYLIMHSSYVAACFSEEAKALDFITKTNGHKLALRPLNTSYPFFLWETIERKGNQARRRFFPVNSHETMRFMLDGYAESKRMPDTDLGAGSIEEHNYGTLVKFSEDFTGDPNDPGADYMGRLDHEHIDNEWLDRYVAQAGIRQIWDLIR